jgi:hypothetical protein
MMVAVAVIALALGCSDLWQRRRTYQGLALDYDFRVFKRRLVIETVTEEMKKREPMSHTIYIDAITDERRAAEYLGRLKEKYEYAASHPWITVQPDPPEPDWIWRSEGPH